MNLEEIFDEIQMEINCAELQYPVWPSDKVYAASIVSEESGELVQAANDYQWHKNTKSTDRMKSEAIQTAAMAIRFLENL